MDNVSSHSGSNALTLSIVTVKFTSHLQPLDGGIIQAFKLRYCQKLMEYVLALVNTCASGTTLSKQITMLNAVAKHGERTIRKCFQNCGFKWDGV